MGPPLPLLETEGFNVLQRCRRGPMLFNRHDVYIGGSLAAYGEFCEIEIAILLQCLRPGDVAIDVGANIGVHTVAFAQAVGPRGRVFAFEPQRLVFQTLCANLAINGLTNVVAVPSGVAEAAGTALVPAIDYGRADNFGGISLEDSGPRGEAIELCRLDDRRDIDRCRLIKIDVEGMESGVLEGARALIAMHRPILSVENDRVEKSPALIRAIWDLGYDAYWNRAPMFNPANANGNHVNIWGRRLYSTNLFCTPREMEVSIAGLPRVESADERPLRHDTGA